MYIAAVCAYKRARHLISPRPTTDVSAPTHHTTPNLHLDFPSSCLPLVDAHLPPPDAPAPGQGNQTSPSTTFILNSVLVAMEPQDPPFGNYGAIQYAGEVCSRDPGRIYEVMRTHWQI